MEIRFGRPIVSNDGERVGIVAGLMLDTDCRRLRNVLILHGTEERVLPYRAITSVNADGILDLNVSAFEVRQMTRGDRTTAAGIGQNVTQYTSWVSGEGIVPSYTAPVSSPRQYHGAEDSDLDPDIVEIDSEIVVAGPDGKVVGSIAGLTVDETGAVQELMISAGFLRPDIRVDMNSVEYAEGGYVSHLL